MVVLHVYPGIFAVAGFGQGIVAGMKLLSTWSQSIRDKEFLVEMRLRNLEPTPVVRQDSIIAENGSEVSEGEL